MIKAIRILVFVFALEYYIAELMIFLACMLMIVYTVKGVIHDDVLQKFCLLFTALGVFIIGLKAFNYYPHYPITEAYQIIAIGITGYVVASLTKEMGYRSIVKPADLDAKIQVCENHLERLKNEDYAARCRDCPVRRDNVIIDSVNVEGVV